MRGSLEAGEGHAGSELSNARIRGVPTWHTSALQVDTDLGTLAGSLAGVPGIQFLVGNSLTAPVPFRRKSPEAQAKPKMNR